MCNQCLSFLTLWDRIPTRRGVLDTALCDKVCQWLVTGRCIFPSINFTLSRILTADNLNDLRVKFLYWVQKPVGHFVFASSKTFSLFTSISSKLECLNYMCNQCLSFLTLWDRIPTRRGVLDTALCDKVCQWLVTGRCIFPGTPVFSTNKTDCHDITDYRGPGWLNELSHWI
jgi:hypothetical protein